ncbi:response regulator transcription factor [Pedobacter sp. Leaf132]|uniref:response regulator transcription factor n=1 Tax=Pedobacter sp. Leaf132 TaxID=2876557 RepID=UPI001E648D38|nr:response regulator transcription factor [Pedobacter sp. Leaf132]
MEPKIKIIVVDDHKLFLEGLCVLLSKQKNFEVIGKASNGKEALHLLNSFQPDVLIMDLNMPIMDGQIASEKVINLYPFLKILVLSMYNTVTLNADLKKLGIKGYLPKDTDSELLFSVINDIYDGKTYFKQPLEPCLPNNEFTFSDGFLKKHNLTHREVEILKLIGNNFSSSQIATKLYISIFTVDTHRKNMIQKLNVDNKNGLLNFAKENNLS